MAYMNEIYSSSSYFTKRLYLPFIEEMFEIFSINFLKEIGMIDNVMKIFNDSSVFIRKLLFYLQHIFLYIENDSKLKFTIFSKLEGVRKNSAKDLELKNVKLIFYELES
jgi:hypothetical protein